MERVYRILVVISLIGLSGILINAVSDNQKKNAEPIVTNTSENYEIKALKLPEDLEFAGEKVPIQDKDVYERVDRELLVNTYWQSNGLLMFKRANKYFPVIEPILARYGVPDDFKYLALIESGLQNITSPSGAKGFWQIMKTTGREYGLEINENVDERYDLEKATEVACQYLLNSKQKFGSWTLAAAAYNAGNKRISDRLGQQQVNNYYDLLLNDETSRYVPRIVAVKEIISHPKKYGFSFDKEDLYIPVKTYQVKVDTVITDITKFAQAFNMTYKDFKKLNPWLREGKLNNKTRKQYFIKLRETD
jgi:hypothetical protein